MRTCTTSSNMFIYFVVTLLLLLIFCIFQIIPIYYYLFCYFSNYDNKNQVYLYTNIGGYDTCLILTSTYNVYINSNKCSNDKMSCSFLGLRKLIVFIWEFKKCPNDKNSFSFFGLRKIDIFIWEFKKCSNNKFSWFLGQVDW